MTDPKTLFGIKLPRFDMSDITGKLIVIEGTDGVGRSSQIKTLKDSNLSLNRENKEMHLNIEKLKTLEQELELKSRRK